MFFNKKINNIKLINNFGFCWYEKKDIFVKGYFFDAENNFYEKEKLVKFFDKITSKNDFVERIKQANGIFTVLISDKNKIYAACDKTRMFPLFYHKSETEFYISDDIEILKTHSQKRDNFNADEFNACGYVSGKNTLLKNVFQIQAGEYLIVDNKEIASAFFFDYFAENKNVKKYSELKKQAEKIFDNTFKRLIKSLQNRPVILPLSGGYDSRLIAAMLKKYNYKNVICFTYGRKNNYEIENSKRTAKLLNYKWIFIEYNKNLISNYLKTNTFHEYAKYSGQHVSMPFLQEYFAVKYLKDNKIINQNAVFIPGHSGDLIGGSHLKTVKNKKYNLSSIVEKIFSQHYILNTPNKKTEKSIKNKIKIVIEKEKIYNYSVFDNQNIRERQAKFINNSSHIYNFFGFEHRFPFWDNELVDFFKNLPFEFKKNKFLYDNVLKTVYFKPCNLNFEKEIQPTFFDLMKFKIKNKIKKYLPYSFTKKSIEKTDWLMYREITKEMIDFLENKKIKINTKVNSYNAIITKWYLEFINL